MQIPKPASHELDEIPPIMHSHNSGTYLPTEVIFLIAEFLDFVGDKGPPEDSIEDVMVGRQKAFFNFCLVSRQWYSVGITFLYRCPYFPAGHGFRGFVNTVCARRGARRSKSVDFGSLVHILSLSSLVHHSTNSLTARLLGQTKQNLRVFSAPRVSFAVNSLPALSKCHNIHSLDLSLVSGDSITFPRLKKAISSLLKLEMLALPTWMSLICADNIIHWPPHLCRMTIGGTLDPEVMSTFEWPPSMKKLSIWKCTNLNPNILHGVLENEQLRVCIQHLELVHSNWVMFADEESDILYSLPNLIYLKIPMDLTQYLHILPQPSGATILPLRALELTEQYYEDPIVFDVAGELVTALSQNLSNLWALGICTRCLEMVRGRERDMEKLIWKHVEEGDDDELEKLDDLGLYALNDDL